MSEYEQAHMNIVSAGAPGESVHCRGAALGQQAAANQVRKATPAEQVRDNAERLVARLSTTRSQIESLQARLCGELPSEASKQAGDSLSASGFIAGTSSAVERAHIEISMIDQVLAQLGQVI